MNAATAGFDANGMLQVEHLVVKQVLDGAAWGIGTIEDAAYDDGVMGGVVVAQHAAGVVGGPGERGSAEESVEESGVQGFEYLVQIVVMACRGEEALAAARLADMLGLFRNGF